jgi:peptidyl-prolyl cis-trans isomerase D
MGSKLRRVAMTAFVILIAVVFAVFFGQQQGTGSGDVAEVGGTHIRRDVFEAFRSQNERGLEGLLQGLSRNDQRQFIDNQTLDGLIRRAVLTSEAEELGLDVTDAELTAEVQGNPEFQQNGRFARDLFEGLAAGIGLSVADLLEETRNDVLLRKFQRFTTSPVRVSRAAMRFELQRRGEERSLRYAAARTADFAARVAPDEAASKVLVDRDPERVRAVFEARRAEFQRPEQVRARHILFTGDDAEARATAVGKRLEAGESFDKLARELSEDAATAGLGGDLGWFPRGLMSAELDAVAFEQLEPGKVSAPLRTERGWHLVRLEEKRAAQERSFEDVAGELAREILVQEQASEQARAAIDRVLEAARASGDLESAAREAGLEVSTSARFKRSDAAVPGLGSLQGLVEVAFALDTSRPIAGQVFQDGESFYAVALAETHSPEASELDAQLTAEAERMLGAERERTTALWYRARRRALDDAGEIALYPIYEQ